MRTLNRTVYPYTPPWTEQAPVFCSWNHFSDGDPSIHENRMDIDAIGVHLRYRERIYMGRWQDVIIGDEIDPEDHPCRIRLFSHVDVLPIILTHKQISELKRIREHRLNALAQNHVDLNMIQHVPIDRLLHIVYQLIPSFVCIAFSCIIFILFYLIDQDSDTRLLHDVYIPFVMFSNTIGFIFTWLSWSRPHAWVFDDWGLYRMKQYGCDMCCPWCNVLQTHVRFFSVQLFFREPLPNLILGNEPITHARIPFITGHDAENMMGVIDSYSTEPVSNPHHTHDLNLSGISDHFDA